MQSALKVGRFGSLFIYLNYTWLLASLLILWWVALLWLPDTFPDWNRTYYWLVAVVVLALFLMCVLVHEWIHSAITASGPRTVNLFPFGAAAPFRLHEVDPGRAVISALAAPLFNIVLGVALLVLSDLTAQGSGGGLQVQAIVRALASPLGTLNVGLGFINLIPGMPFDGGWLLSAAIYWLTDDRESGPRLAYLLGSIAALVLVIAGAWVGLTSDRWLQALALVLVGWSARQAGEVGQQRGMVRDVLHELKARNFMDRISQEDAVRNADSVAQLMRSHQRYPPHAPIPVLDQQGELAGIVTVAQAEELLQGTWPTTPVQAIMTPLSEVQAVQPGSPLTDVLAILEPRRGTAEEEVFVPVIENGRLVGSIDPGRLAAFEQVGEQFGIEETISAPPVQEHRLSRLSSVLPVLMVLAAIVVLGNIALQANPEELKDVVPSTTIKFSNFAPEEGAVVGLGAVQVSVRAAAASAITTATVTLDGQPLEAQIAGQSPFTRTISANVPYITQGTHNVRVTATTEAGNTRSVEWQFVVSSRSTEAAPTPSPATAAMQIEVVRRQPVVAGKVLAGATSVPVSMWFKSQQPPAAGRITLDGRELAAQITSVAGHETPEGIYVISAIMDMVNAGMHRVHIDIRGAAELFTTEWTFTAQQPDANNVYFEQTGYFVSQPFLAYWQQHGGLPIFGYPVSDRIQETDRQTGKVYIAQYFERARFELHPETGDQVILGRLGAIVRQPDPPAPAKEGAVYFQDTGHNLSGPFLSFWNEHGGLALFGFPITEQITEKNPADGREYTVQYFERARFELHPENAGTPFEVQLGQLGRQVYNRLYAP